MWLSRVAPGVTTGETMDNRSMDIRRHACGGAILSGSMDGEEYVYCDGCDAFSYDGPLPAGTDATANRRAWDAGDDHSPVAMTMTPTHRQGKQ